MSKQTGAPEQAAAAFAADFADLEANRISGFRRTTITVPTRTLKDLKLMAVGCDISLNAVFLACLDALLRGTGRDPVPGLEARLDDIIQRIKPLKDA
jgi:hypothetical protein